MVRSSAKGQPQRTQRLRTKNPRGKTYLRTHLVQSSIYRCGNPGPERHLQVGQLLPRQTTAKYMGDARCLVQCSALLPITAPDTTREVATAMTLALHAKNLQPRQVKSLASGHTAMKSRARTLAQTILSHCPSGFFSCLYVRTVSRISAFPGSLILNVLLTICTHSTLP